MDYDISVWTKLQLNKGKHVCDWMVCRHKLYHLTVAKLVICGRKMMYNLCLQIIQTQFVLSFYFIWIKRVFKMFSLRCYVALPRTWRRRCFHGISAMILLPQIFDVIANENARYKREWIRILLFFLVERRLWKITEEVRIAWLINIVNPILKWYIKRSRSLFLYFTFINQIIKQDVKKGLERTRRDND